MRVSWMERKTNVRVLENIKPEWTLESRVAQAALGYFGHVVREERGMENDVMLGEMSGKRRRPSINNMRLDARDHLAKWRSATAVVVSGRIRLDGTKG